MIGVIGGLLLLAGGGLMGYIHTRQMVQRERTIQGVEGALYEMERELTLHLTPLPALLQGEQLPFTSLFSRCGMEIEGGQPTAECWSVLVDSLPHLGEGEGRILRPLGQVLGRFEGEVQGEALRRAALELAEYRRQLQGERLRMGRVYPVVGATGAAFLGIFLL